MFARAIALSRAGRKFWGVRRVATCTLAMPRAQLPPRTRQTACGPRGREGDAHVAQSTSPQPVPIQEGGSDLLLYHLSWLFEVAAHVRAATLRNCGDRERSPQGEGGGGGEEGGGE